MSKAKSALIRAAEERKRSSSSEAMLTDQINSLVAEQTLAADALRAARQVAWE